MSTPTAEVLFVGERPPLHSPVLKRLKDLGCECSHAASCREALALLDRLHFSIVLSKAGLPDGSARGLASAVRSAAGSLFLFFPVEDSCWWIPVVRDGEPCREEAALRPCQFAEELLRAAKAALSQADRPVNDRRSKPPRRSIRRRSVAEDPRAAVNSAG